MACYGAEGGKGLPINIAFVFEGEEENGSRGFKEAIQQNKRWFEGTKLIVISNTVGCTFKITYEQESVVVPEPKNILQQPK